MTYKIKSDHPIKNTTIYKFVDGKYFVSFDVHGVKQKFLGTRDEILPQLTLRVKRALHVR